MTTPITICPSCQDHDCRDCAGHDCDCAHAALECWVCGENGPGLCACDRAIDQLKGK